MTAIISSPENLSSYLWDTTLVLVHRPVSLLHASFRPHLTVVPMRFATLHLHQVGAGLSPASCRTCTAYNKGRPDPVGAPFAGCHFSLVIQLQGKLDLSRIVRGFAG